MFSVLVTFSRPFVPKNLRFFCIAQFLDPEHLFEKKMAAPNVTANAADISVISAASRNTSRRGSLAAVLGVKYKTSGGPRRRSSNTLGATTASSQNDMLSATVLDHHHFSSDDEDENSSNQEDVYVSGMKLVHLYIFSRKKIKL